MEDWKLAKIDSLEESDGKEKISREDNQENEGEGDLWKHDPFTALMFGSRGAQQHQIPDHNMFQQPDPPQQQGIDYEELMINIDKLIESANGLKPLFQKIFPFAEKLWKKK